MTTETAPTPKAPIACNPTVFTAEERAAHLALALNVVFRLPSKTQELEDGFLFEYRGGDELFVTLARFVRGEHRCCSFARFVLEIEPFEPDSDGVMRLRYLAGREGKAFLAESLDKFRPAAVDAEAHRRLEVAFGSVDRLSPESKDDFYARIGG